MTTVQEILRNKGTDVVSIDASESVQDGREIDEQAENWWPRR